MLLLMFCCSQTHSATIEYLPRYVCLYVRACMCACVCACMHTSPIHVQRRNKSPTETSNLPASETCIDNSPFIPQSCLPNRVLNDLVIWEPVAPAPLHTQDPYSLAPSVGMGLDLASQMMQQQSQQQLEMFSLCKSSLQYGRSMSIPSRSTLMSSANGITWWLCKPYHAVFHTLQWWRHSAYHHATTD